MASLVKGRLAVLNGSEAVALAAKQCQVDLVAAYPITPQTIIVERLSQYVADGEADAEFVCAESEHSALSACIGGSLAGGRVFTATASQGLALMHEVLYMASGLRCPLVMAVANRALSAPINIHSDHSDMMGSRDCGWVQIYVESPQEAYDFTIQAFKIAEDPRVLLPVAVNMDGYVVTHSTEPIEIIDDEDVRRFLPRRRRQITLDPQSPITIGSLALPDYNYEFKRQQEEAMRNAARVFDEVAKEYCDISGREYAAVETFGVEDAEAAVICLGSIAGTARAVARKLRRGGENVGVLKPLLYRPFPADEIVAALGNVDAVAVLDRSWSLGAPYGPLCSDVVSALHRAGRSPRVIDAVYGLGGRDTSPDELRSIFEKALAALEGEMPPEPVVFLGVRE